MTDPPIVAWMERARPNPETGGTRVLRDEWRIRQVQDFAPGELARTWGLWWHRGRPGAGWILEHRYVRWGSEEPWHLFDATQTRDEALQMIDPEATPADPRLAQLRDEQAERDRTAEARAEAFEAAEAGARAEEARRARAYAAFERMLESRDHRIRAAAISWNTWVVACRDRYSQIEILALKGDPEFKAAHDAVIDAETVPKKRSAIKAFLARFGDIWSHGEGETL